MDALILMSHMCVCCQDLWSLFLQGPKQGRRARREVEADSGPAEDMEAETMANDVSGTVRNVTVMKSAT